MPSSSTNKLAWLALVGVLGGCAAPAPSLPRVTSQTTEQGYSAPSNAASAMPIGHPAASKPPAMVIKPVWLQLTDAERQNLGERFDLKLLDAERFGLVMDVQGVDESTKATHAGAAVGAAVGSAAYIDHAFRGANNYSAGGHLALGLLGAAIGSSMDKPAVSQFHFRYTVKLGDGDVKYFDEVKSTQFRHSPGVCLLVPELNLISIHVCNQTPETVRQRLIASNSAI